MDAQEFLQKAQRIIETLPQRMQNRPQVAQTLIPQKQIITVKEAKAMGAVTYMVGSDKALLLKGDVFVQGNIDAGWRDELLKGMGRKIYDVMIEGDLVVAGDIIDNNYLMLQVMGNVIRDYFFPKNGHQYIRSHRDASGARRI